MLFHDSSEVVVGGRLDGVFLRRPHGQKVDEPLLVARTIAR